MRDASQTPTSRPFLLVVQHSEQADCPKLSLLMTWRGIRHFGAAPKWRREKRHWSEGGSSGVRSTKSAGCARGRYLDFDVCAREMDKLVHKPAARQPEIVPAPTN